MTKVIISSKLSKEILKKFGKTKSLEIISLFESLEKKHKKGKKVGKVNSIVNASNNRKVLV